MPMDIVAYAFTLAVYHLPPAFSTVPDSPEGSALDLALAQLAATKDTRHYG